VATTGRAALSCPSAQPSMRDAQVLGVVSGTPSEPRIAYLNAHMPATPELLNTAAPVPVTHVLRLAATCEEQKCTHFDGETCQLAARIVRMLNEVVDGLPACVIRKTCRWFAQEGRAACLRCPQVVTGAEQRDELLTQVAGALGAVRPMT
jgi:hypothetical protein